MKKIAGLLYPAIITIIVSGGTALAHFGMVIPSANIISAESRHVDITLSFSHPFEGIGMELQRPQKFYVIREGEKTDLLSTLFKTTLMGHTAWQSRQKVQRPGLYQYVMEPEPYWEAAEDLYITHYSKTIVAAFGADEGWDHPAGLPTEIVPHIRPYGNYAGNSFSGQVLVNGKAVPHAKVEVEYYNNTATYTPVSDYHITQVVKADSNGIFSFTCPIAGWWGFAALTEADFMRKGPDGTDKNVELGAVLWVFFDAFSMGKGQ